MTSTKVIKVLRSYCLLYISFVHRYDVQLIQHRFRAQISLDIICRVCNRDTTPHTSAARFSYGIPPNSPPPSASARLSTTSLFSLSSFSFLSAIHDIPATTTPTTASAKTQITITRPALASPQTRVNPLGTSSRSLDKLGSSSARESELNACAVLAIEHVKLCMVSALGLAPWPLGVRPVV